MDSNSMNIDEYIKRIYERIDKRYIVVIICSLIAGLVAHGMALFNRYSFHDDSTWDVIQEFFLKMRE